MTHITLTRRAFAAALAAATAFGSLALTGCGDKTDKAADAPKAAAHKSDASVAPAAAADRLAEILAKGEMTIATEGTWAPWTYHDEKGVLTGFDIEVGRLIAAELGVKPVFVEGKWDGLLAGIDAGRFDIMINGVDVTPEREKAFLFSEPYVFNRTVVITRSDDERVKSMDDLKGLSTANTISSTYAEIAERHGAKVTGVDDLNQTIELLLSKRIDATLNSDVVYHDYLRAHPDAKIRIAAKGRDVIAVAIPLRNVEASKSLKERIDAAVAKLRESGRLSELSVRFFGGDLTKK